MKAAETQPCKENCWKSLAMTGNAVAVERKMGQSNAVSRSTFSAYRGWFGLRQSPFMSQSYQLRGEPTHQER